jgi:hypothetical protein
MPQVPAAPTGVTVTPDAGKLAVSWDPVDDTTSYEVRWGIGDVDAAEKQAGLTTPGYTITTGVTNGAEYKVWVRAKNDVGDGDFSAPVTGTPNTPDAPPAKPSSAPNASVSGDTISVSWTSVAAATTYKVFFGTSDDPTTPYGAAITATSIDITAAANGTYYVRIKAGNSKGYSDYSPSKSVTVSGIVSIIGTWRRDSSSTAGKVYFWEFKEDGTLVFTQNDQDWKNTYYYDAAARKFYGDEEHTEEAGYYEISGGKLRITEYYSSQFTREGTGSGLAGTWRRQSGGDPASDYDEWVFAASGATQKEVRNGSTQNTNSYLSYTVAGSVITLKQQFATLQGGKLVANGMTFDRVGSGTGPQGKWTNEGETNEGDRYTYEVEVTSTELKYTLSTDDESPQSGSMPITIEGNNIISSREIRYALEGNTLTIIEEGTDEFTPVG